MRKRRPSPTNILPQINTIWTINRPSTSWVWSRLGVPLDYVIHGSGRWGFIFVVYLPRVDPKGPALVRFNIKKNAKCCSHKVWHYYYYYFISNKFIDIKKEHPSTQGVYKGSRNQIQKLQEVWHYFLVVIHPLVGRIIVFKHFQKKKKKSMIRCSEYLTRASKLNVTSILVS